MDSLSAKSQQALDHEHETARPGRSNPNNLRDQVSVSEGKTMWPSPRAVDTGGMSLEGAEERMKNRKAEGKTTGGFNDLKKAVGMFPTPRAGKTTDEDEESWLARHAEGKVATPPLALAARLWATPTINDSKNNGSASQQERRGSDLNVQVARMLPTPTTQEIEHPDIDLDETGRRKTKDGRTGSEARSLNLADTARMLPTPTGDDANNVTRTSGAFQSLSREVEGSLSPDWVEWLMGIPLGWSSMQPLPREEYLDWFHAQQDGTWWQEERGLPRVSTGIKDRVNRLKCLGNGIVPASLSLFLRGTR